MVQLGVSWHLPVAGVRGEKGALACRRTHVGARGIPALLLRWHLVAGVGQQRLGLLLRDWLGRGLSDKLILLRWMARLTGLGSLGARLLVELVHLLRRVWCRGVVLAGHGLALIADEGRHLLLDLRLVERVVHNAWRSTLLIAHIHGLVQCLLLHQLLLFNSTLRILLVLAHGLAGAFSLIDVVSIVHEHVSFLVQLLLLGRVLIERLCVLTLRVEALQST